MSLKFLVTLFTTDPRHEIQLKITVWSCFIISFTASSSSCDKNISLGCSISGTTSSSVRATQLIICLSPCV